MSDDLKAQIVAEHRKHEAYAEGIAFAAHLVRYVGSDIRTKAQIVAYLEETATLWRERAAKGYPPPSLPVER